MNEQHLLISALICNKSYAIYTITDIVDTMPPTSNFGQDITNTTNSSDIGNNNRGSGDGNDPNITNIERMGGMMLLPKIAGRGVIRVVERCEDAKENKKLGKKMIFF